MRQDPSPRAHLYTTRRSTLPAKSCRPSVYTEVMHRATVGASSEIRMCGWCIVALPNEMDIRSMTVGRPLFPELLREGSDQRGPLIHVRVELQITIFPLQDHIACIMSPTVRRLSTHGSPSEYSYRLNKQINSNPTCPHARLSLKIAAVHVVERRALVWGAEHLRASHK